MIEDKEKVDLWELEELLKKSGYHPTGYAKWHHADPLRFLNESIHLLAKALINGVEREDEDDNYLDHKGRCTCDDPECGGHQ